LGVLQGLLRLPYPDGGLLREQVVSCVAGNLVVALVLLLLLQGGARLARRGAPRAQTAFWIGWGLALMPFAASILQEGGWLGGGVGGGVAVGALVLSAAPLLGRRLPLSFGASVLSLGIAVGAAVLAFALGAPPAAADTALRALPPLAAGAPELVSARAEPPDVVLISVDTLRADAIVGADAAAVPHLDRLRAEGTWAAWARSSSNQTLPGHVGMLTGLGTLEHGVRSNREALPDDLALLSERFHVSGWRTAGVVTNGLLRGEAGFSRGFELYDDTAVAWAGKSKAVLRALDKRTWLGWLLDGSALEAVVEGGFGWAGARVHKNLGGDGAGRGTTDRALHYLDQLLDQERPYFLFVHYIDPHSPYGAPAPFRGRRTAALERPLPPFAPPHAGASVRGAVLQAIEDGLASGDPEAAAAARWVHQLYLEEVEYVDSLVGELVARVESGGRPTVILLTGDHGEHFGEHGLLEHSNSVYEPLIRVPFILWGANPPGGEIPPPAVADVAPTLLHAAGIAGDGLAGRPVQAGPGPSRLHVARDDKRAAFLQGQDKLLAQWRRGSDPDYLALHDLAQDPGERSNLLGPAGVPAALLEVVRESLSRDNVRSGSAADADQRVFLEEMGYAGDDSEGN